MKPTLRAYAGATFAWLLACAIIVLPIWPFMSGSRLQWLMLIVFGPPYYALGRYAAHRYIPVSSDTSARQPTILPRKALRITVATLVMLALYALTLAIARAYGIFD